MKYLVTLLFLLLTTACGTLKGHVGTNREAGCTTIVSSPVVKIDESKLPAGHTGPLVSLRIANTVYTYDTEQGGADVKTDAELPSN